MQECALYYKPTCPFCQYVLEFLEQNNISITLKNIIENSTHRKELIEIGGKQQVPCLVCHGKALYESEDIIEWVKKNHGTGSN